MDFDKFVIKCIVIIVLSISICMMISSVASSVSNYHISIKAMENGYVQQKVGSTPIKLMWVKENKKEN